MKIKMANRIAPDGTPRFAAPHLGLFCLPMSNKKDAMLIWVKLNEYPNHRPDALARSLACPLHKQWSRDRSSRPAHSFVEK